MGQPLQIKHFNWVALENAMQAIVRFINFNCPVEGDGIRIVDSDKGKIISVSQDATSQSPTASDTQQQTGTTPQQTPDGSDAGWQTLTVIDNSTGTCVQVSITYWGTPAVPSGSI